MSLATLEDHPSVDTFFNIVETLALFEHLSFELLEEFGCSPQRRQGEHEKINHRI